MKSVGFTFMNFFNHGDPVPYYAFVTLQCGDPVPYYDVFCKLCCISYMQGEIGFGERGFKELVKGMTKSSGALQVSLVHSLAQK